MDTRVSFLAKIVDLGLVDYKIAYERQKEEVSRVIAGGENVLILCEHPAVLTMGRLASEANILIPKGNLEKRGIGVLPVDRGGEITLHAPGQLVAYPIFNLDGFGRDLKGYMFQLEEVIMNLLKHFDIESQRIPGKRGVWVGEKKIASIGIGVRRWVSFHGLAVNVNMDLDLFSMIRPCGLDVAMTSMQEIKRTQVNFEEVKEKIRHCFTLSFNIK